MATAKQDIDPRAGVDGTRAASRQSRASHAQVSQALPSRVAWRRLERPGDTWSLAGLRRLRS
jgi:hypothetical protein